MADRRFNFDDTEDKTLTIPDFVEDKTTSDSSVDMSIFKMSDDELYDDADDETEEDDFAELKPKKKKSGSTRGPLIVCLILIFILLAACAGAAVYAMRQHQAYVKANTDYLQVMANEENYKRQLAEKDAQITSLQQQIAELQSAGIDGKGSMVYVITDGPVNFRKSPSRTADLTEYKGRASAANDEEFKVIEEVKGTDDPDYRWAKVDEDVYFCVGNSSETYATRRGS